jgi:hypothetical protein
MRKVSSFSPSFTRGLGWAGALTLAVSSLILPIPGCSSDSGRGPGSQQNTDASAGGSNPGSGGGGGSAGSTPIQVVGAKVTQNVGPAGGTVTHSTGAQLQIPPGALASPVPLTMEGVAPASASDLGGNALGQAFQLGPEGQQFLSPVTIVVPFDPTRVPAGQSADSAVIMIAPVGSTEFAALETTVDLAARTLTAQTLHFSVVAPVFPSNPNPLFIKTSSPLPGGQVGTAYGPVTFQVSGGSAPYTWTTPGAAPPQGLSLSPAGSLAGTPTVAGSFSFAVRVTDSAAHRLERLFGLTIQGPPPNPLPGLTSVSPTHVLEGSAATAITLVGSQFVSGAHVLFDASDIGGTYASPTQIGATIPANLLTAPGKHTLSVTNPAPGGGTSNGVTFTVDAAPQNPVPVLSSLSPNALPTGSTDTQISVYGQSFVNGAFVVVGGQGGQALATTFVSATELAAVVPANLLGTASVLSITVYNPAPGGGYSGAQNLTVGNANPAPSIRTLSQSVVAAGSSILTLDVFGASFVNGSMVYVDQTLVQTSYVAPDHLQAFLTSNLLSTPHLATITVVNPQPGGGTSNGVTLSIVQGGADGGFGGLTGAGGTQGTGAGPGGGGFLGTGATQGGGGFGTGATSGAGGTLAADAGMSAGGTGAGSGAGGFTGTGAGSGAGGTQGTGAGSGAGGTQGTGAGSGAGGTGGATATDGGMGVGGSGAGPGSGGSVGAGGAPSFTTVTASPTICGLATDGTDLFIGHCKNAGISKIPLAGGQETPVVAAANTSMLVVDSTYVYWADTTANQIERAPKGSVSQVGTQLAATTTPSALQTDTKYLYWIEGGTEIHSVQVLGGTNNTLVSGETGITGFGFSSSSFFFSASDGLDTASISGGTPPYTSIAGSPASSAVVSSASSSVYWLKGAELWYANTVSPSPALVKVIGSASSLTPDGDFLYYLLFGPAGGVFYTNQTGQVSKQVVADTSQTASLVVGPSNVYWRALTGNTVEVRTASKF